MKKFLALLTLGLLSLSLTGCNPFGGAFYENDFGGPFFGDYGYWGGYGGGHHHGHHHGGGHHGGGHHGGHGGHH